MTRLGACLIGAIALLGAAMPAGVSAAPPGHDRMPPGSFLRTPAYSRNEVLHQVTRNSALARRYAHAFHTTPDVVIRTFGRMHLIRLTSDLVAPVFYVHPGEHIGMRVRRLRMGTKIFISAQGAPLLVQICGNPLRSRMPLAPPSDVFVPDFQPYEPLDTPLPQPLISVGPEDVGPQPYEPESTDGAPPPDVSALVTPNRIGPDMFGPLAVIPGLFGTSDMWWLLLGGVPLGFPGGGPPVPEPPALPMLGVTVFTVALVVWRRPRRRVTPESVD